MNDDRSIDMIVAFGIGLIAGATAALLMAPASGEETRRRLGEGARDAGDRIRDRSRELGGQLRERYDDVSGRVVETSREASERVRDTTDQVVGEVKSQADRVSHAIDEGKKAYAKGK